MCVNDVLCQGGRPLAFLDYLAAGRLSAAPIDELVAGVVEGCHQAGCDLIGETARQDGWSGCRTVCLGVRVPD